MKGEVVAIKPYSNGTPKIQIQTTAPQLQPITASKTARQPRAQTDYTPLLKLMFITSLGTVLYLLLTGAL
jgi:hypothetical protein